MGLDGGFVPSGGTGGKNGGAAGQGGVTAGEKDAGAPRLDAGIVRDEDAGMDEDAGSLR